MKEYRVKISYKVNIRAIHDFCVEAKNEEEAEKIALQKYNDIIDKGDETDLLNDIFSEIPSNSVVKELDIELFSEEVEEIEED